MSSEVDTIEYKSLISDEESWWWNTFKGYSSGVINVLLGHPFDTVKVRLQTNNTSHLFKNIYRGVIPPLISTPTSWSWNFFAYQTCLKLMDNNSPTRSPIKNAWIAGSIAGIVWALCMHPFEQIKCYSQRYHLNSYQSLKQITKHVGTNPYNIIRYGLYRGFLSTLIRDVPGGVYFPVLEMTRIYLPNYNESPILMPFIGGSITGIVTWMIALPGDRIKSIIQTEFALKNDTNALKYTSFTGTLSKVIKLNNGNPFCLWKGFGFVSLRAVFCHGTSIAYMEILSRNFSF